MIPGFGKTLVGPVGTYRVELQQDVGMGPCKWSVEHILVDDRPNGPVGSNIVGFFPTQEEALGYARLISGLRGNGPPAPPLPDRRGLVAHSRNL
jgi:hypothetical protein